MKKWPDPIHEAYLKLRKPERGKHWRERVSKKKCREIARSKLGLVQQSWKPASKLNMKLTERKR